MTRPPQPQEYPGDAVETGVAVMSTGPKKFRAEFCNPFSEEPYEGSVWVLRDGVRVATVDLQGGIFEYELPAGQYHLVVEAVVDGVTRYLDMDVTV